ncbi:MAG: DEAD/DEAH box helicase family protein [Opitutaceae bacterium]
MAVKRTPKRKRSFHQDLVLNRWLLGFFNGDTIQKLKLRLGEDRYEGLHEDGQSLFFHELTGNLFNIDRISEDELRRYDLSIVTYWDEITTTRNKREGHVLQMKYFQYLSLLFTEIYLDWYFNRKQLLLDGLNEALEQFHIDEGQILFQPFVADDLNKIAFWNATGSGKTLLLHVNIKQYLHYFQDGRNGVYPDKIILLTPNEGLSKQHLEEAQQSGFGFTKLFEKDKEPDFKGTIEVIDINKLGDTMGDKTVAVDAFEGNNLVLVDEGHRGTGSDAGAWMRRRSALISNGFAFEYSATFGQAVGKGPTVEKAEDEIRKNKAKTIHGTTKLSDIPKGEISKVTLTNEDRQTARNNATRETYAKCTLFDYSYKYFYEDGYGKEFLILNLKEDKEDDDQKLYFTACLLSFYQQIWLWETKKLALTDYNIEKPLWVFVGNKVNDDDSDILTVTKFLGDFLNTPKQMVPWIADLIADNTRILDVKGNNIFHQRFLPMMGREADEVYHDILKRLFNADAPQRLKLVNIKSSKGELALRVGESEPFGLINVGEGSKFHTLAENNSDGLFDTESDEFGGALFGSINRKDSPLNVLIGSRKFTEGWSSWRVSTMGLLNMGTGEGSQIIQLFGRGVRLKGSNFSLKRTSVTERPKGLHLDKLETLNIFGVRANYMAKFKDYLKEEGITPTDEILELDFPTKANLPSNKLKTLGLKDGYKDNQKNGFKRKHFPDLYEVPAAFMDAKTKQPKIKMPHVVVDLYPRIEALSSTSKGSASKKEARSEAKLSSEVMEHFNWDQLFLAVQDYKLQRSWSNLRVSKERLKAFCFAGNSWYTLYAPAKEMQVTRYSDVFKQQRILTQLLIDYTDRFYKALKNAYEGQFYEVIAMDEDHSSMLKLYHFEIEDSSAGQVYHQRLEVLKQLIADGKLADASKSAPNQMVAICFDRHLYYPLLHVEDPKGVPLKLRPMAFDAESEVRFVKDLETFYKTKIGEAALKGRSLYLLRNADSKGRGLGFATAGNFYPDFLLWLVDDETGQQWLNFVDPKGIRNIDLSHPKLQLYREVKNVEKELKDPKLTLNAFILSGTSFEDLLNVKGKVSKNELEDRHVLFMDDVGKHAYLKSMFNRIK